MKNQETQTISAEHRSKIKICKQEMALDAEQPVYQKFFPESALFFDIESTGFSGAHTHTYLIGCAARQGDKIKTTQFFAETPLEEPQIIQAFLELVNNYRSLISYNGMGFDVPYLKKRCACYGLAEQLEAIPHLDIYRKLSKCRSLLKLENLKQKSLEQFLGMDREDKYSGGDLIEIYQNYTKQPSEEACSLLLLHNYEDLLGMAKLMPLLSYPCLLDGEFQVISQEKNIYEGYDGNPKEEWILTLSPDFPLPRRFSYGWKDVYLTGCQQQAKLKLPILQGELKHFYPNYKDYYYLPAEDRAIHKSVAFFVDKEFRTKAKASTCYIKKTGYFLPQYQELFTPCFQRDCQDQFRWFEMTEEFLASPKMQKKYALHVLQHIKSLT